MRFIATCKMGLEYTVSRQLLQLGMKDVSSTDANVRFSGDYNDMCRAALWLRTAERLFLEVKRFHAESFEELYQGVYDIRWQDYLGKNTKIHVNGKSARSRLFSVLRISILISTRFLPLGFAQIPLGSKHKTPAK